MYEEFFGLTEKPFNLTPDPHFLYLSKGHREALDHLLYGLERGEGFICIYGDVGVGKTTVCRELMGRLNGGYRTALILNPTLTEKELVKSILKDFGLEVNRETKKDLLDKLNSFLLRKASENEKPVIIIDEAQNLSFPLLEQVRMISNLEADKFKLVQIILVGQKELQEKLASKRLRQLNQRVTVRYEISPLSGSDSGNYISHRLAKAGSKGQVSFTDEAARRIFRLSRGIPRLMNLACDRAMLAAFVRSSTVVGREDVKKGVRSLGESESLFYHKKRVFAGIFG